MYEEKRVYHKLYCVAEVQQGGKREAFVVSYTFGHDNMRGIEQEYPGLICMMPCKTKKAAQQIADEWNENAREQGVYMWQTPKQDAAKESPFDMFAFMEAYGETYDRLYDADGRGENPERYAQAVDDFDALSKTDAAFRDAVQKFVEARDGDLVSSDREAAAFMMTYDGFMENNAAA